MSEFYLNGSPGASAPKIDYAAELNQEQLDVVLHGDGPCIVLAGAGSGKTRTLTYRVAYLLEHGLDPSRILLLTFTNKAAREMLDRVGRLLGGEAKGIWGGTFHAVGSRILRSHAAHLGYAPNFSILDQEDSRQLIKAIMKEMSIDPKARRFPSPAVVQDLISYARNTGILLPQTVEHKHPHFHDFVTEIEEIARHYQLRKKSANVMDFDDLLTYLALILEDPVTGDVISDRFEYVLVDEYQDTNTIQARIVKGFARRHENIVVVGDDAQSIYAFRGADVKNILSFPDQWPDAKMFRLVTNYRSTPEILEVANESLANNVKQFKKQLVGLRSGGEKPKLIPCSSASEEAQYVAQQILLLRDQGIGLKQIAVLFRSSAHSQALEFELMRRDIPYDYRGGQKFFDRAHIRDIISYLRLTENIKDEVAWLRVLNLYQGIGTTTASAMIRRLREVPSLIELAGSGDTSLAPNRAREGWRDFLRVIKAMTDAGPMPSAMIRALCASSYRDYLEREYPNWQDRLEDLEQLSRFAERYDEPSSFLNDIALFDDVVTSREETASRATERLVLSTIHQAKGLEWDAVFIMHLADTAFPNKRAMGEDGGMEEERRLFYVAVTRARTKLFLTYPMTIGYDTLSFAQPSTFIQEVPPRLFDRVELRHGNPRQIAERRKSWSWDEGGDGFDEPAIELDRYGEKSGGTGTVFAPKGKQDSRLRGNDKGPSFLRDVDEL
ncbi:MAG: UvrD-helicase domain-containing protein [bacterium]|nr:UvrD-helicase domain-containing protein [bacterium]